MRDVARSHRRKYFKSRAACVSPFETLAHGIQQSACVSECVCMRGGVGKHRGRRKRVVQQPIKSKCRLVQWHGIKKEWCMLISAIIAPAIKRDWPPRCDVTRAVGGPCGTASSRRAALSAPREPLF